MSIEITIIVTIISASIALASLIITGQNGLRREMREQQEQEMQEQGEKHSNEITEVKNDLTEVKLAVAALKATVDTYFRVRVDPPQQAAVAEGPEDYGRRLISPRQAIIKELI